MSLELIDLRAKIDEITDVWLTSLERGTGETRSETVRKVLHAKALSDFHSATLLVNAMQAKGIAGSDGE